MKLPAQMFTRFTRDNLQDRFSGFVRSATGWLVISSHNPYLHLSSHRTLLRAVRCAARFGL